MQKDKLHDSFEAFIEESMQKIRHPEIAFPLRPLIAESGATQLKQRKEDRLKDLQAANEEQLRNMGYLLE